MDGQIKEFYISAEQLASAESLFKSMIMDRWPHDDPRSPYYQRTIIRPKIKWIRYVTSIAGMTLSACFLRWIIHNALSVWMGYAIVFIYMIAFCCIHKRCLLCETIRIYQRYAPETIRRRCCCEPSCSNYMILSIEKYGSIKGVIRGIKRLKRCNPNTGGFDVP